MVYKNRLHNGFTLIELIVVIAILGFVSLAAYSVFIFGHKSFAKGEARFDMQTTLRQAADEITKQVREAQTLEIMTDIPATFVDNTEYIYIKEDSVTHKNAIYHRLGASQETMICSDLPDNLTLSFQPVNNSQINLNNKILDFQLSASHKNESFDLSSQVLLLNSGINYINGSSGSVIVFGPLSDSESTLADKAYLSTIIPFTVKGYEIKLPVHGPNGTDISWESTTSGVIVNVDTVSISRSESEDITINLRATINKNAASVVYDFQQTIPKITELVLDNKTTTTPYYNIGTYKKNTDIRYTFHATGGNGIYSYSFSISPSTGSELSINSVTGELSGKVTNTGEYIITVTVTDTTSPTPKTDTSSYTLNITNN